MDNINDTFYFLAFPSGDEDKITVIDLGYSVDYQRDDWANVNSDTYFDHTTAIDAARAIAIDKNLEYVPFESRYNSELNEDPSEKIHRKPQSGEIELFTINSIPVDETVLLYWSETNFYCKGIAHNSDGELAFFVNGDKITGSTPTHWSVIPVFKFS